MSASQTSRPVITPTPGGQYDQQPEVVEARKDHAEAMRREQIQAEYDAAAAFTDYPDAWDQ